MVEYRLLHEAFEIAHTYTFLTKNFYGFETVFCIMIFGIFSMFLCVLCRAKILPQIYTRIIASLKPPPYTRIICEKNFAQIYMRIAVRLESVSDWLGVGILAFVCIMFCICGHRLKKVVFVVDWLMSKFGYKSVMGLHKFIVKMWLCRCNCMCMCVCIWY